MGPWRIFSLVLLLGLVAFGVLSALRLERLRQDAVMRAYGLRDNSGRVAVLEFVEPPSRLRKEGKRLRVKALLMAQKTYHRHSPVAEELGLSKFVYLEMPGNWGQQLVPPYTGLVTLGPSGSVLESFFCEKPCSVKPLLPYAGYVELRAVKKEDLPQPTAKLNLLSYEEAK